MEFLASDAMRGRGSGTHDEWVAATYVASQLEQYGVDPAGDNGTYLQRAVVLRHKVLEPPQIRFETKPDTGSAREFTWTHGKEMLVLFLGAANVSGPLQKVELANGARLNIKPGSVLFVTGNDKDGVRRAALGLASQGAAAILIPASDRLRARWQERGNTLPKLPPELEGVTTAEMESGFTVAAVNEEASAVLRDLPDGTVIHLDAPASAPEKSFTWNAIGKISGTDPAQRRHAILLSAHLDHLGIGPPVKGDDIYNGADDDASGTTAVLEIARVLGSRVPGGRPKPRRTVIFALFGSEEAGGLGSIYFRERPPIPLEDIAANLEFEMIGRRDPRVPEDTVWLTGWERSDLGPALAAHGARLVADPHPEEGFFRRSDNYVLAKEGVVAQTVSSFGLHSDYHQPSDKLSRIDFNHMDEAIQSMLAPIMWLTNSNFVPRWKEGGKP
jgi:aminopeptidase YwaD